MIVRLVTAIIIGGFIGFLLSLMNNEKRLDKPYRDDDGSIYFGFLYSVMVSASAALLSVTILVPGALDLEIPSIIGISIIAGISGESVLLSQRLYASEQKRKLLDDAEDKLIADIEVQEELKKLKETDNED